MYQFETRPGQQDVSNADGLAEEAFCGRFNRTSTAYGPAGIDGLKNVLIRGGCRRISTDVSGRPRLYPDTIGLSG